MSASPRPQNLGSDCTVHYTTNTGFQNQTVSPLDTKFEISGNQNTTYYFVFSVVENHQLMLQVNILIEYEIGKSCNSCILDTDMYNHVLSVGLCQIDLPQATTVRFVGIGIAVGIVMVVLGVILWSELSQYK